MNRTRTALALTLAALATSGLTACKSGGNVTTTDITITSTLPSKPGVTTTPHPTLDDGSKLKEIDKSCPYISNQDWADGEGNRVGRSVQLNSKPVGCRFYFEYNPTESRGQILVQRFATAVEAYNAMVYAAHGHPEFVEDKTIADGAIARKINFDGGPAWQCVFAKGTLVVTVQTSSPDTSLSSRDLAAQIAPLIK